MEKSTDCMGHNSPGNVVCEHHKIGEIEEQTGEGFKWITTEASRTPAVGVQPKQKQSNR